MPFGYAVPTLHTTRLSGLAKLLIGKGLALYLLTSDRNEACNSRIVSAAGYWQKHVGGPFVLKVYGSATRSDEDFMHGKVYLFLQQQLSQKCLELPHLNKLREGEFYDVKHAYFGSCNFTHQGLGIIETQQHCEMLAKACDNQAKIRLLISFLYFWHYPGSHAATFYNAQAFTGGFV